MEIIKSAVRSVMKALIGNSETSYVHPYPAAPKPEEEPFTVIDSDLNPAYHSKPVEHVRKPLFYANGKLVEKPNNGWVGELN